VVNFNFFEWIRQGVKESVLLAFPTPLATWVRLARETTSVSGSASSRRLRRACQLLPPVHTTSIAPRRKKLGDRWETSKPPPRRSSKRKSKAWREETLMRSAGASP